MSSICARGGISSFGAAERRNDGGRSPPCLVIVHGAHGCGTKTVATAIFTKTNACCIDLFQCTENLLIAHFNITREWWRAHWDTDRPNHRFSPRRVGVPELNGMTPLAAVEFIEKYMDPIDYVLMAKEAIALYETLNLGGSVYKPHVIIVGPYNTLRFVEHFPNLVFINVFRKRPRAVVITSRVSLDYFELMNVSTIHDLYATVDLIVDHSLKK